MIKNIVFDLGNVLVDFNPMKYLKSFKFDNDICENLNEIIFKSEYWLKCDNGEYNNSDIADILCEENPDLEHEIKLVLDKDWVKMLTLKEDTADFLKSLKQKGYMIYILSNLSEESYEYVSKYNFFKLIDGGTYSYRLNICKPNREIYDALILNYNINPNETIFIDDNEDNINMAIKLGINGIVFDNLENVKKKVYSVLDNNC